MRDVQCRMQRVVLPIMRGNAESLEAEIHGTSAIRRGELDNAECADRVKCIVAVECEPCEEVAERDRLEHWWCRAVELECIGGTREHRAVHAAGTSSPHLVPVIARE